MFPITFKNFFFSNSTNYQFIDWFWLVRPKTHADSQRGSAKTIDSWNVALKPANFSISWTKWEDQMAALPNTSMEADAIQRVKYFSFSSSS